MIPVLGLLMMGTLVVALFSNLAILPANILVLKNRFAPVHSSGAESGGSRKTEKEN